MNAQDVKDRMAAITDKARTDDEGAHAMEDKLLFDVLTAISNGAENTQELATEVLKSTGLDFARWTS